MRRRTSTYIRRRQEWTLSWTPLLVGAGGDAGGVAAAKMHAGPKPGAAAEIWAKPAPGGVGIFVYGTVVALFASSVSCRRLNAARICNLPRALYIMLPAVIAARLDISIELTDLPRRGAAAPFGGCTTPHCRPEPLGRECNSSLVNIKSARLGWAAAADLGFLRPQAATSSDCGSADRDGGEVRAAGPLARPHQPAAASGGVH
jgi:hypothetical protein